MRPANVVLLAAVGLVAACGWWGSDDEVAGTCLRYVGAGEERSVTVIDCERPHDLEVIGHVDAAELGRDWPGDAALSRWAFQRCVTHFEEYVGSPYGASTLDLDVHGPTQEGWAGGERGVRCAVTALDGERRQDSARDGGVR